MDDNGAQTVRLKRKSRGWVKWCAMPACLCLAAGAFLWYIGFRTGVKEMESQEEITPPYGLSIHSDSSENSYACLDMVLDEPKDDGNQSTNISEG